MFSHTKHQNLLLAAKSFTTVLLQRIPGQIRDENGAKESVKVIMSHFDLPVSYQCWLTKKRKRP